MGKTFRSRWNVKRVAIDFDGVLAHYTTWKGEWRLGVPNEQGILLVNMLHEAGVDLITYTCRNNPEMNKQSGVDTSKVNEMLQQWLIENGIAFCELYTGCGKPWAHAYVDDRSVYFPTNVGPAETVFKEVMWFIEEDDIDTSDDSEGGEDI